MPVPQGFQSAKLQIEGGDEIQCAFNPESYSVSKTNLWTYKPTQSKDWPEPEFGGGLPMTYKLSLLLDTSLQGTDKTIKDQANALMKAMHGGGSAPKFLTFSWGANKLPKAAPMSISIQYALFAPNGDPTRAFVDLELGQAEDTSPPGQAQNPTTRGTPGLRSHIIQDGDSLHAIAYESYGDATRWRVIAEANDIDDPLAAAAARRDRTQARFVSATSDRNVSLYSILVDGSEIETELSKRVREVRVLSYLRLPDMCTFSVVYQKGKEGEDEPIDGHPFDIGKTLEVKLGARDELTTTTLFKGQIVSLEMHFGAGGVELLVRGFDRSHVLIRSRKVRTFQNQTSSDIVEKIVKEAGFEAECDPSGDPHEFMQQDNETDWDFIWRLAERVGFEFVVSDQKDTVAHFRKQAADDPVALQWPQTLRSFSPRVTATQQVQEVTLSAQDPKTKQAIAATASSPEQIARIGVERATVAGAFEAADLHIATEPVKSQAEGTALAQALLDKLANGYIAAEGVTDGNPSIRAGAAVQVSGLGQKYSGTYRVAAATHVLRGGSTYETRFANSPAHTLLGAVGGDRSNGGGAPAFGAQLVLGLVTNNSDPENLGRVRVQYPALSQDAEGAWARVVTPSAGNQRGLLMLPVVGEEVLVGFENDDTTRPYVLGSLFNGVDQPGDDLLQSQDGSFALLSDEKIVAKSKDDMKLTSAGALTIDVTGDVTMTGSSRRQHQGQQRRLHRGHHLGDDQVRGLADPGVTQRRHRQRSDDQPGMSGDRR